jgi:hypothetical protein
VKVVEMTMSGRLRAGGQIPLLCVGYYYASTLVGHFQTMTSLIKVVVKRALVKME